MVSDSKDEIVIIEKPPRSFFKRTLKQASWGLIFVLPITIYLHSAIGNRIELLFVVLFFFSPFLLQHGTLLKVHIYRVVLVKKQHLDIFFQRYNKREYWRLNLNEVQPKSIELKKSFPPGHENLFLQIMDPKSGKRIKQHQIANWNNKDIRAVYLDVIEAWSAVKSSSD